MLKGIQFEITDFKHKPRTHWKYFSINQCETAIMKHFTRTVRMSTCNCTTHWRKACCGSDFQHSAIICIQPEQILGAFAKLRKSSISYVMSARLSVYLSVRMEQLVSHWTDFYEIWHLSIFIKSILKIQVLLKSDTNNWYFTGTRMYIYDVISLNSS